MTDAGTVDRTDALTVRMLDAIDALPVPPGPGGLRTRRTVVAQFDRRPLLILLLVALAVALATPTGRSAVAEAARLIQRLIGAAPWSGYYVDLTARDATGISAWRLMFAKGAFPGAPTQPEIASTRLLELGGGRGWWSADGDLFAVGAGTKILVGDRAGRVREVADAGEPNNVYQVAWTGPRRISAVAREADRDVVIVTDLGAGTTSRQPLPRGMRIDAASDHVAGTFSPDGRWLIVPVQRSSGCRSISAYDLTTDRLVELIDGTERRGRPIGWLRDSRLVWATCDIASGAPSSDGTALNVFVSAPDGSGPIAIGTIPQRSNGGAAVVDAPNDRILFTPGRADDPENAVWALGLDGGLSELVRLPDVTRLAPDPAFQRVIHLHAVSRDGRLLAFRLTYVTGATNEGHTVGRAGYIDLATGALTFACAVDCNALGLR